MLGKKTKKFFSLFLSALTAVSMMPLSSVTTMAAQNDTCDTCGNSTDSNGFCTVDDCGGYEKPSQSDNKYQIENAGHLYWFANYVNTTSLDYGQSIDDGYTISTIANDTFRDCTFINSLVLPDTIREVGSNAFNGCVNLNKIVLSSGITKIYADTFYNTAYYNNIKNWEDNVLYIGEYLIKATANCIGEYTVKDTATTIAINALSDCKKLELIFIPKNVVVIGSNSLPYYAKICGYSNTAAEEYKIHYNRTFCYLDDETKNFIYNPIAPHSAEITNYTGISEKL